MNYEKLKQDMFTVKDSTYNEMMRDIYSKIAEEIGEKTNLKQQVADSMRGQKIVFIDDGEGGRW